MRVLLLNLTRFGDLLQTQALIRDLADAGHTVGMVCLEPFMAAAGLLHGVDSLWPLPGSALLRSVDEDWRQGCVVLDAFAERLRQDFAPEAVFNLTASLAGRLLGRRLTLRKGDPELRGFGVDASGFGVNSGLWAAFFEASSRQRGCSPYNIVDVFRKLWSPAHGKGQSALRGPDAATRERIQGELATSAERSLPQHSGLVAFQLGASEERRQWPVTSFAELGRELSQRHGLVPVLLGTQGERPLAETFAATGCPHVDMAGRTSLPELAAALYATRLLITNDTGTMHLAAGLGVPSLSLFLATAQPWDTGPYLAGCCCLEPDLPCHPCGFGASCPHEERCRTRISPATVARLVEAWLTTGTWPEAQGYPEATETTEARIWLSELETNASGWQLMNLVSLSGHEATTRTALLRLQRHLYCQLLDWDDQPASPDPHFTGPAGNILAVLSTSERADLSATLEQINALLHLLQEQGKLVGITPSAGQRFLQTLHTITRLLENSPVLNALGRLWTTATQERGDDLQRVLIFARQVQRWLNVWQQAV